MGDHLPDGLTGGLEVLPGVELVGVFGKELANGGGHGKTQIGVYVYLADSALGGLTELILGHTDGAWHIAAVFIDLLDKVLGHAGGAVQDYGEAGQILLHGLEDVETELGLGAGLELVSAVAGADGDGQGVAAGALNEFLNLFRAGVAGVALFDFDLVLNAGEGAELGLDDDAVVVSVLDDLLGDSNVLLEGLLEASIMTEVKPPSMQLLQSSKLSPWSRCRAMGRPVSMTAASTSFIR